jgi:multiple sugar transport system ATP-binding protein
MSGTIERTGDPCFVQVQGQRWALAGPRFANLESGQAVKLAIRPNYLKVASTDDDIAMLKLRGKVELVELLGAEALVTLEFAGERLAALVPASELPALDSVVTFQFKLADLHVFDAQTEQNVSLPVAHMRATSPVDPLHRTTGVPGAAVH